MEERGFQGPDGDVGDGFRLGWGWSGGDSQQNSQGAAVRLSSVHPCHPFNLEHLENSVASPSTLQIHCSSKTVIVRLLQQELMKSSPIFGSFPASASSSRTLSDLCKLPASPCPPLFSCVCPLRLVRLTRNYPEISREGISWWTKADLLSLVDFFTQSQTASR